MNIALIGLGMVAGTHVRAISAIGEKCNLVGVMSRSLEKSRDFLAEHYSDGGNAPKICESVAEIADDAQVDLVIVCTPPNARQAIVSELAGAGKPILLEKPIERTLAASREIVDTCDRHGVSLGLVFQHRMRASAIKLQDLLAGDRLGAIAIVEISVPWWRDQAYYNEPGRGSYARDGGGVLITQAIHTLDLALSFAGPVARVQAMAHRSSLHQMESEDFVAAGLEFASGAIGSLVVSTASFPGSAESIILHCQNGTAVLKSGILEIFWHDSKVELFGEQAGSGAGADPMAFTHVWHQAIIEDFIAAVQDGRDPVASGRSSLAVHELIDALIRSSNEERGISVSREDH